MRQIGGYVTLHDHADPRPDDKTLTSWQNEPPACPYCGSDQTWLFDVYFGRPVWACDNPACPNVEHEHFFDLADLGNSSQLSTQADQKAANAKAVVNNERLASEVNDLKIGLEMVEERARQELGMVKPNEVFVQVTH